MSLFEQPNIPGRILVTGGAGFIGAPTVACLLSAGVSVTVLDNLSNSKLSNLPTHENLRFIAGDVRDPVALAAATDGVELVLHLAAQVSVAASIAAPLHSADVNVIGFLAVLEAMRHTRIKRLVYASSAAVYANSLDAIAENAATAPASPYGMEKLINDQYAGLYANLYGLSILGLRYFNVYGVHQTASEYAGVLTQFAHRIRQGQPLVVFGDGTQSRDFIHVSDVVALNCRALFSALTGVLNVASGGSVSVNEIIATIAEIIGIAPAVHYTPTRAGDIQHSYANIARLRQAFGAIAGVGLRDGLAELLAEYR